MTTETQRRLLWAAVLAAGLIAPNPVMERIESPAARAAGQAIHARPGPGPRPARRGPRRAVRHDHRHDHYDDVRRARRGRTIARAVTTIAVGTRVRTLPANCTTVITRNVTYRQCGGAYYRPYYEGTTVVYVVVEAP